MKEYCPVQDDSPWFDATALRNICKRLPPNSDILEIGCGNSTKILKEYGKVKSVDVEWERIQHFGSDEFFLGDSKDFKPDKEYDLIFIDGCHAYESIKFDIDNLYPAVKVGGFLCGHDMECLEYDEAHIHEDLWNNRHNGVIKAVTEKFTGVEKFPNSSIWCVRKIA